MKVKIAYMVHEIQGFGGSSTNMLSILEFLDRSKYESMVFCPRGSTLIRPIEKMGIEVKQVDYHAFEFKNPLPYLKTIYQLIIPVVTGRIDIIHLNHQWLVEYAVSLAKFCRKPIVVHFRGIEKREFIAEYLKWYNKADLIVAVSKAVADNLTQCGADRSKVKIVQDGISLARFSNEYAWDFRNELGIEKTVPLIGIVGDVAPEKGQADLLHAAKRILTVFQNAKFVVVGSDNIVKGHLSELRDLVRRLGIAESVYFTGFRTDISSILHSFNVSVLASWQEAFANVVLESIAADIPVVATHVGGVPEIVINNKSGMLVPPKDSNALANAIIKVLQMDKSSREDMVKTAKLKVANNLTVQNQVRNIEQIYNELLETKS